MIMIEGTKPCLSPCNRAKGLHYPFVQPTRLDAETKTCTVNSNWFEKSYDLFPESHARSQSMKRLEDNRERVYEWNQQF